MKERGMEVAYCIVRVGTSYLLHMYNHHIHVPFSKRFYGSCSPCANFYWFLFDNDARNKLRIPRKASMKRISPRFSCKDMNKLSK